MLLMLDNYDSFTYNLVDYFGRLGVEMTVIRNDVQSIEQIQQIAWRGIVLSPGPRRPEASGILMELIASYAGKVPILGICLGHQAIGLHYGASLYQMQRAVHGKTSILKHTKHEQYAHCPVPMEVCRYHSLAIKLSENSMLTETAWCTDPDNGRVCMSMVHKELPLWSVQYHPEAILTNGGLQVLENWLNVFNLR